MYYVVIQENKLQNVYSNWSDCEKNTKGVKNVLFKKFSSITEMCDFISVNVSDQKQAEKKLKDIFPEEKITLKTNSTSCKKEILDHNCYLFVDGSYNKDFKNYSYGFCVVSNCKIIYRGYGKGNNQKATSMQQIAGELQAVTTGLKYLIKNNFKSTIIVYDYQGIEAWANKSWKTKNEFTQQYVQDMQELAKQIDFKFMKVESHLPAMYRNDFNNYNEIADKLAKQAFLKN